MLRVRSVVWLLALTGCYVSVPQAQYDEEIPDLVARLDALEAENAALRTDVAALQSDNDALTLRVETLEAGSGVTCPGGCVGQDDLAAYVTDAEAAEFLVAADLAGVEGRLTALEAIDPLTLAEADVWIAAKGYALDADHDALAAQVAALDLLTLAEVQAWVGTQGFATESWVGAQAYATDAALQAMAERLGVVEGDYVVHAELTPFARQTDVDDVESRLSYVEGDYVSASGSLDLIDAPIVLAVPSQYATIQAAVDSLDHAAIVGEGSVSIVVEAAHCGAVYTAPIRVAHRDAGRVRVDGPTGVAADCVLTFSGTEGGLVLPAGYALGGFRGFTLAASGPLAGASGIEVAHGSALWDGGALATTGWSGAGARVDGGYAALDGLGTSFNGGDGLWVGGGGRVTASAVNAHDNGEAGVFVTDGAVADLDGGSSAARNRTVGFWVASGGLLRAAGGEASENGTGGGEHAGFQASAGWLLADGATAHDNDGQGFFVRLGGQGWFNDGAVASGNTLSGFYASGDALLWADGAVADDNGGYGFVANDAASLMAAAATATDNAQNGVSVAYHSFGWLPELLSTGNRDGVQAFGGSFVFAEGSVVGANRAYGVRASWGSTLMAAESTANGNNNHGLYVELGSRLSADGTSAEENGGSGLYAWYDSFAKADDLDARSNQGHGVYASYGSYVDGQNASAQQNGGSGYVAEFASGMTVPWSDATDNGSIGYFATEGSSLSAHGGDSNSNGGHGFYAVKGSYMSADDAASVSNTWGFSASEGSYFVSSAGVAVGNALDGLYAASFSGAQLEGGEISGNGRNATYADRMSWIRHSGSTTTGTLLPADTTDNSSRAP